MTTMTDKEYFSAAAISKSQLHAWDNDNPMAFWRGCKLNPHCEETEENDAICNGKLRHTLLLEPGKFESEFVVIEGGRGFSSRSTKAFQEVIEKNPGLTVVTQEEYDTAKLQTDTLKSYQLISDILAGGSVEQPFFWKDEATGLPLKAKLDLLKRVAGKGIVIVEYKTTGKDMEQIERGIDVMGWHWDAGMQYKAVKAKYKEEPAEMFFIVQSQKEGCENLIRPFVIDTAALQFCAKYVDDTLAEINNRFERWKQGDAAAWKTNLKYANFLGYSETPFSFKFDKELSKIGD